MRNENSIKHLVQEWVFEADHDARMAENIFHRMPNFTDVICFHCYQAVDKYLKAFSIHYHIDSHHSLTFLDLITGFRNKKLLPEKLIKQIDGLSKYSLDHDDSDDLYIPSVKETEIAIKTLLEFRQIIDDNIDYVTVIPANYSDDYIADEDLTTECY